MKLAMYETHIPAWNDPDTWASRLTAWQKAGVEQVQFVVEDGNGATWPSAVGQTDSRVNVAEHPLRRAIKMIRQANMQAIPVFGFAGIFNAQANIKPEYLLDIGGMYNVWSDGFVSWRMSQIRELVNYEAMDGFGIDYIRCGRWARPGELPQHQRMDDILSQIRTITAGTTLMSITNSMYHKIPNGQGIDVVGWYRRKYVDKIGIFNYDPVFPADTVALYPKQDLCLIVGNYNVEGNPAVSKTGLAIENMVKDIEKIDPAWMSLFNGNLHKPEHAQALRSVKKRFI